MGASPTTVDNPIGELNTTPLIDVLLVLLILFVITIPAATHSIEINLPSGQSTPARIDPVINKVSVSSQDQVLWNGTPVSQPELAGMIATTKQLPIEPELQFAAEAAARYELAAQTVRTIKLAGAERIGMIGNEQHAEFDKGK